MKIFDTVHNKDDEYTEKAQQKSKDVPHWLYLATKNHESTETVTLISCTSEYLASSLEENFQQCLQPITNQGTIEANAPNPPLYVLAASGTKHQEVMEILATIHTTQPGKLTSSFT